MSRDFRSKPDISEDRDFRPKQDIRSASWSHPPSRKNFKKQVYRISHCSTMTRVVQEILGVYFYFDSIFFCRYLCYIDSTPIHQKIMSKNFKKPHEEWHFFWMTPYRRCSKTEFLIYITISLVFSKIRTRKKQRYSCVDIQNKF